MSLLQSLLTGSWRLERQAVRETLSIRKRTQTVREMMVVNHQARMQLYAGAEPGINRKFPNPLSTPDDYRQAYQRITLIMAARQMEEDYGFFDGLLDDFETYVVGEYLQYLPNTGNADANRVIREFLEAEFDEADFKNQMDLTKMAQVAVRSMKRDGECGFILRDVGDTIKIHAISGDGIGNPTMAAGGGPNDYGGIITDPETEEPIRYDLYRRLPKINAYTFARSVGVNDFRHYYDPFRFQQYHGVSAFKNAIRDAFDIDQILEFTKLNIKWRASQLPTVHTETGRPRGRQFGYFGDESAGTPGVPTTASGQIVAMQTPVDGVTTTYLKTDEQVMEYPNDFPNASLQVSLEEFRRQSCKGVKIPYEFAYRADAGGVVQRFWANKAENTFKKDKRLLRRALLDVYKNRRLQKGIDTGELDLSSFGDLDVSLARFRGQWQMGRDVSVDYGKENDTDIKLIYAGLMSRQDKAASMGTNLDETDAENDAFVEQLFLRAERISKKVGQPVEIVLDRLQKLYPNPPSNQQAAAGGVAAE